MTHTFPERPKLDGQLLECLLEEIQVSRRECLRVNGEQEQARAENHLENVTQVLNDLIQGV